MIGSFSDRIFFLVGTLETEARDIIMQPVNEMVVKLTLYCIDDLRSTFYDLR